MTPRTGAPRASVAQSLVDHLAEQGLRHVFVVPGMQIDPVVKALANHPAMLPIVANHELAAGYMADGYARASGGIGAAIAIGGPGCANLIQQVSVLAALNVKKPAVDAQVSLL